MLNIPFESRVMFVLYNIMTFSIVFKIADNYNMNMF